MFSFSRYELYGIVLLLCLVVGNVAVRSYVYSDLPSVRVVSSGTAIAADRDDGQSVLSSEKQEEHEDDVEKNGESKHMESMFPLDINRASLDELTMLPGIGPTLARRIIDYREREGPFGDAADLLAVQGIGAKRLERIRPLITLEAVDE